VVSGWTWSAATRRAIYLISEVSPEGVGPEVQRFGDPSCDADEQDQEVDEPLPARGMGQSIFGRRGCHTSNPERWWDCLGDSGVLAIWHAYVSSTIFPNFPVEAKWSYATEASLIEKVELT
jgi:hypothetical protein